MSYNQGLSATHSLQHPGTPARRRSKKGGKIQTAAHARAFGTDSGNVQQNVWHLAKFIKTRKRATACILAAAAGLTWFAAPFPKEFTLSDLLREEGYWETVPPAEYYLPGTINTLEVGSDGRVTLHPTCKINSELLGRITLQSRTVDRSLAEKLNKKFAIEEHLLPIEMKGSKVRNISLRLRNSSVLEITDEELIQIQREVVTGACQEAIEINIHSGATVCQTQSALRGDLVYDITYGQAGSASTKDTEPGVQVESGRDNEDQVVGKGLIYGVSFVPYGIVLNSPDAKPADCRVLGRNKV
jgi:hypothetical protein